jgi:hypothetical protein
MHTGFWWRNLKKRGYFEDLGVIGRIIFKKKYLKETVSEDLSASGCGHVAGFCKCGNELPGFIKYGKFLY